MVKTRAQVVGAKFTLEEVGDFNLIREGVEVLKMIAGHVDGQGAQLTKLGISMVPEHVPTIDI